jgi:mono/diheme cytochrome c family protein
MQFRSISAAMLMTATLSMAGGKTPPAKLAAQLEEGRKVFEANCLPCHGAEGKGDGVAAAALDPKPRDFTDAAYMKTRSVATLRKVITEGGQSVGLSATMVAWGGTLTPDQIDAVLQYVRQFSKTKKAAKAK